MKFIKRLRQSIKKRVKKIIFQRKQKSLQNQYDLTNLQKAKKLSVFLIPGANVITGGIVSIFNMCKLSRELDSEMVSLVCTYPGNITYARNTCFENNEDIYRFKQILNHTPLVKELILHIPEYFVKDFYRKLTHKQISQLKSIDRVRINILNQNIGLMPRSEHTKDLYNITQDITHSVGFKKFATQEVCDRYKLPLYYVKSSVNLETGISQRFEEKQKKILYSPDHHPMKKRILNKIQSSLPDFKLEQIQGLTYGRFLEAIADSAFCITFGEGFDGFYIQPYYANSIGITVYNEKFFPSKEIKNLPFVYRTYSDLYHNIIDDISNTFSNSDEYKKVSSNTLEYLRNVIDGDECTKKGLGDVYNYNTPMFTPTQKTQTFQDQEYILTAIIFTYNHENTIAQCIESIVKQNTSYKYQIHIWDDASIDSTSEICRAYSRKYPDKIDLIVQDANTFLNDYHDMQSYHAIKKVNTKYFCIIDGDDMWLDENKIQIALDFLEHNPEYVGFGHDTMEINTFSNESKSYIHDIMKWNVENPITLKVGLPFILTSSRIFRNIGYGQIGVLPIDYLLYYYHLAHGPIYYYDKIMASYLIGEGSTFAASNSTTIKDANCMFPSKLSKLFKYQQDEFCTTLLKSFVEAHYKNMFRYKLLLFLKKIFGVKLGWKVWFHVLFVKKYGKQSKNIHYVYSHSEAKARSDKRVKK